MCDLDDRGIVLRMGRPPLWIQSSGIMILHLLVKTSECSGADGMQFAPSCLQKPRRAFQTTPTRPGVAAPSLGRLPAEIESYYKVVINVDMDYFNILNLVIVPRLEPKCERRYRMPRGLYESVRVRVLEMKGYSRQ
jgi:hypothetical protein